MSKLAHRGLIEGFYGDPWTHADRLWMIEQLGRLGMNRYVYAPKDDPFHLERWREPYPEERLRDFAELVETGDRHGVTVGFAVSPGRSIRYSSAEERALLVAKFSAFQKLGARFLSLALDDVPSELREAEDRQAFASIGEAHLQLMQVLRDALPEPTWWLVPLDYLGTEPTDYLELLGERLDPDVEIAWTGRTIVSPTIRADEAARRAATLRRRPLIWDNTPVADGPMRSMLHLGPYTGREAGLVEHASGILLNPMSQARASLVALSTAAAYMEDPVGYDAEAAWTVALDALGGPAASALRTFGHAHRFSALCTDDRDAALEAGFGRLRVALETGAPSASALDELDALLAPRLVAADTLRANLTDAKLRAELEPWLVSHRRESRRMEAALAVLRAVAGQGPANAKFFAFMGMEGRFTLEPENGKTSYGPRRVVYPQLRSMRDAEMAFADDPVLLLDRCLADEFVALAESQALRALG